ncbi:MAG TPA: hypothetical protein VK661_08660 [Planctomycetota bacterium]|nr:hypothetical protein [Planctomycetota bacterium]
MDEERLHEIVEENRRLRQRVFDLESRQVETRGQSVFSRDQTHVTKVLKLLEQRDHTVEDIAAKLDKAAEDLEEARGRARSLEEAAELATQAMGDGPELLFVFSREGKLLLHNRAADRAFGGKLPELRLREIEAIDWSSLDPYLPVFLRQLLATRTSANRTSERGPRKISATGTVLGAPGDLLGVLLRITVAAS